jgi:hypothetical protein
MAEVRRARARLVQFRGEWLAERARFQAAFDRGQVLQALAADFDRFAVLRRQVCIVITICKLRKKYKITKNSQFYSDITFCQIDRHFFQKLYKFLRLSAYFSI